MEQVNFDIIEDPPKIEFEQNEEISKTICISNSSLPNLNSIPSAPVLEVVGSSSTALNLSENKKEKWKEKKSSVVDIAKKFHVSF